MAPGRPAAQEKLSPTYLELRRELKLVTDDARKSMAWGGAQADGSTASTPDTSIRQRLDAQCGDDLQFWKVFGKHVVENTREPLDERTGGQSGGFARRDGKAVTIAKLEAMLPTQLIRVRDTLPAAGQARFLREGETLGGEPADTAAALRQRAEWLVVLEQLTSEIDRQRLQDPKEFGNSYVLGLWTKMKCDLGRHSGPLLAEHVEKAGFPTAEAGADTQRAFLLLVGISRDPQLARTALDAARQAPTGAVAPEIVARLEAWAR